MAWGVNHLDVELPNAKMLAVREQVVKITAVRPQISRVEDWPEDALHILDMLTNTDPGARLGFDVRGAG